MPNLHNLAGTAAIRLFGLLPIDSKKLFFISYQGKYSDNPRAIYEELQKTHPELHYVWVLEGEHPDLPKNTKVVRARSLAMFYHMATAKIWIDNTRKPVWTRKRKHQFYIQTWHGGLGFKKCEKDCEESLTADYLAMAKHDSSMMDLILSGSAWQTDMYERAFWYNGEIQEYGLPRSDALYQSAEPAIQRVRDFYGLKDENLLLYAPTFRADENTACYNVDFQRLLDTVTERFGGTWKLLVRLHPIIQSKADFIPYSDAILNGSLYPDMNDLIRACSLSLTDYSSWLFDAMELGKPVLLYASDLEEFLKDRGLYFRPDELPLLFAENNDQLMDNIRAFDLEQYQADAAEFLSKVRNFNDGHAAEKTAERILQELKK